MKKSASSPDEPLHDNVICHMCNGQMQKVSWKITAGAFDAGKEVEQTVFVCPEDKNFVSIETSTGNPSEFASPIDHFDTNVGF